ncbi:hypothetical protein AAG570_008878 [Ranatra chinensis]|uniref:C2 domain-containing protein n=1 Tax=Ranatra chinensis TaxID=642074 RepID=A0ABD0YST6_9HEMI
MRVQLFVGCNLRGCCVVVNNNNNDDAWGAPKLRAQFIRIRVSWGGGGMLKWTVAQRAGGGGGGAGRGPGCVSPCCPAIPRPPFKINIHSSNNRQRRSSNRKRLESQENQGCEIVLSPKTRELGLLTGSALRDVSNTRGHEQTPPRTPGISENNITRKQSFASTPTKTGALKRPRSPRKFEKTLLGKEELRLEDFLHASPERKKQPCAEAGKHKFMMLDKGNQTLPPNPALTGCKYILDSTRSLFQIEYTPRPIPSASSLYESPDLENRSVFFVNQSPSPVELDHKEIPLRPEEKEVILATPICARGAAVREEFSRILTKRKPAREIANGASGVSPLALRLAHLRVEAREDLEASKPKTPPDHIILSQQLSTTTTKSIPMPFCRGAAVDTNFLANHILLEKWPSRRPRCTQVSEAAQIADTVKPRDFPMTNHDRNAAAETTPRADPADLQPGALCSTIRLNRHRVTAADASRKRRGVVFNENYFSLNTPPTSESEERQSSTFTASIDLDAPSSLKRQRAVRRRRPREPDVEHRPNKIPRRPHPISCLTLPHGINTYRYSVIYALFKGIPSPFEGVPPSTKKGDMANAGKFVGLTLPEGIPSPPSPGGDRAGYLEEEEEPLAGVEPLLPSPTPRPPHHLTSSSSLCSEDTWDSHQMHFLKTPRLTTGHVLHGQQPLSETSVIDSASSSKIQDDDDDDGASSLASSSVNAGSPHSVSEGVSRSRRCLTFASPVIPSASAKRTSWKQPDYTRKKTYESTMETPLVGDTLGGPADQRYLAPIARTVQSANHLTPAVSTAGVPPFSVTLVVSLVPAGNERTFHRTCVRKDSRNPRFDDTFSFEITEADLERRILVSAWHRDRGNRRDVRKLGNDGGIGPSFYAPFRRLAKPRLRNLPDGRSVGAPRYEDWERGRGQA